MPTKPWPSAPKLVDFDELYQPIRRSLMAGYSVTRRKGRKSVPYDGYRLGDMEAACAGDVSFEKEDLAYHAERGRSLLDLLFGTMFSLGVEQGRRCTRFELEPNLARLARYDAVEDARVNKMWGESKAAWAKLSPARKKARMARADAAIVKLKKESTKKLGPKLKQEVLVNLIRAKLKKRSLEMLDRDTKADAVEAKKKR